MKEPIEMEILKSNIDSIEPVEIEIEFEGEFIRVSSDFPAYDGEYEVTPSSNEQILETTEKTMYADIVVKKIPYFEVSNESGGTTVSIGNEV